MPQSMAVLTQMAGGYTPLASGWDHHRRMPFDGLPGMDTPLGSMAAMAMQPQLYRAFGQQGMLPMGVDHDQNVYDRLMNQRFTSMQMRAMHAAAESDRASYMKTFRGMAAMTGTPFGAEQRRAAMSLSNLAVTHSPMFAEIMPEFLDQMGGVRGSATVMARRAIDAGRYRLDPVTGRMGMSAETTGAVTNNLYSSLYNDESLGQMRGLTAGKAGSLFQELQLRGMIGTAAGDARFMGYRGDDPRGGTLRAMEDMMRRAPNDLKKTAEATGVDLGKGLGGLSGADLDKLNLDPRVSDRLRSFDADRIKKSINSYVGVITAMRDIFGDSGHPNAPMSQLLKAVEAMTAGSMSQLDPSRLSGMVRQTYNLAKQTGVSLDNALVLQQHAGVHAQRLGLEPIFAVQATQGSLGFGGAYRSQGHAAHTAWGAMDATQLQQLDANLRVQAAGSSMANRMAVAMRVRDQAGGFAAGSDVASYTTAIQSGLDTWTDSNGRQRSMLMQDRDFNRMLMGATGKNGAKVSVSEGDIRTMLGQDETNREYVDKYNMSDVVRRAQGKDELHPFVGNVMRNTLFTRLRDNLMSQGVSAAEATKQARSASGAVSQKVTRRMFDMSTSEMADRGTRNTGIGDAIAEELGAAGYDTMLKGMTPEARQQFLQGTADIFYGSANRAIGGSQYRAMGNLQNVHRLTNRTTLDEADRQQMQARFTAEMQESLSPLGHGTVLQRAVDALQHMRSDDPRGLSGFLAEALGGVKIDDINQSLMPHFERIRDKRSAVVALQDQIAREKDPRTKAQLLEQLNVARRELSNEADMLSKTGEQFGLFGPESLSRDDVSRALGTSRAMGTARDDVVGLRGGFGHEVSPRQIADAKRAAGRPISDGEAGNLVREQRRAIPLRATDEDIDKIMATNKGSMTRDEAAGLANARLRSQRLGIDKVEVEAHMKTKGLTGPQGEMAAMNDLMAGRIDGRFKVSDQDRADFTKANPNLPKDADVDRMILQQRQSGHDRKFGDFWKSEHGAAFRETVDLAGQDAENVAEKLLRGPGGVLRYGTRAIEMSESLRSNQQRLRELALYHAGGDMAKLLAGNLSIDTSTAAGQATWKKVQAEVMGLQGKQQDLLKDIQEQSGGAGRQFQLGDEGEARRAVRDRMVASGKMSEAEADKLLTSNLSPDQLARVRSRAAELGSDAKVREFLGYGKNDRLSDFQRAAVAGIRHGVGNAEEAALIYGRERWGKLSAGERDAMLTKMRAGTGDRAKAMELLGLTDKDMKTGTTAEMGDKANRVEAIVAGLRSDIHAKRLAGGDDPDKLRGVRTGIGTEDWARDRMGLAADPLSADMRDQIRKERERTGDKAEAMRLLGYADESKLGIFGKAQLLRTTKQVGLLRGMDADQEDFLIRYQKREDEIKRLADGGLKTKAATERHARLSKERDAESGRLGDLAAKSGVGVDELVGATGVTRKMLDRAAESQRKRDADPTKTLKGILEEYGFSPGETLSENQRKIAQQMTGTRGSAMGTRILESAKNLRGVAERGLGVDANDRLGSVDKMSKEYFDLVKGGDQAKLKDFQKKFGIADKDWERFEKDMQFQQQIGGLSFGRMRGQRTKNREEYLSDIMGEAMKGGTTSSEKAEGGAGGKVDVTGHLAVTIKADGTGFGDLSGQMGGGRNYPVSTA